MTISDAQYDTWLKADGVARTLLAEAKVYSGGAEATRYMSNRPFVSNPLDTPANIAYDDIIQSVPAFTVQMSEQFGGHAAGAWGDLVVTNENGARDTWLNEGWDGRALSLYLGQTSWRRDDFRAILKGVSADIVSLDRNRLALRIRDKTWMTNINIQTSLIGGGTANANKPKPLCFGQCFNVEPPLVTSATHEYQVHDGQVEDITDVRDNGLTVGYTKDLANGKFTLTAAPAGRITADVKGAKPSGVYIIKCADIINHIVTTRTAMTGADIDSASFTAFNTTAPQTLGLWVNDFMSAGTALDLLVTSVGGFWTFDRTGLLTLGRLEVPSGTPALELVADDIGFRGLKSVARIVPVKTYRLSYKRNWTPQSDGLAGAVTEANRALYAAAYQVTTATNAGVSAAYLLAQTTDEVPSLLADATEAATECTRRATLWGTLRQIYQANCFAAPFKTRLGQVINGTYPRFGFNAGKLATVIGIKDFPTRGRTELRLFA